MRRLGTRAPALALLGCLLAGGGAAAHDEPAAPPLAGQRFEFAAPEPGSYRLPAIKPAPDAPLLDSRGRAVRLHALLGERVVLLSLVYLQCRDACPVASAVLRQVRSAASDDAALRSGLALVTVSFDPARDTPEALAAHAGSWRAGADQPPWRFYAAASLPAAEAMTAAFGQPVRRPPGEAADIAHLLRVYLIDTQRRVRNIYGLGFLDPRLLLADLRTLLGKTGEAAR